MVSGLGVPFDTPFNFENQTAWVISATTDMTLSYNVSVTQEVALTTGKTFGFIYPLMDGIPVIKYRAPSPEDPVLIDVDFHVETWDYHTVRLSWTIPESITQYVSSGTKMCITRSTFGYPTTTEDGVKVAHDLVSNLKGLSGFVTSQETIPNELTRPPSGYAALYDNNLSDGLFYYYGLFFFVQDRWVRLAVDAAITPKDFRHRDALYRLLPEYYIQLDNEFPGSTTSRDLYKFLSVVGFELDYVRTMAEYVERIYDADAAPLPLLQALGAQNLGLSLEGGLGDLRYRSLLANINRLYDRRGTKAGIESLVTTASKYDVTTSRDINLMILPDDSSFATGLGSWGVPFGVQDGDSPNIIPTLSTPPWGIIVHNSLTSDLNVNLSTPFANVVPEWSGYDGAEGLFKQGLKIVTRGATTPDTTQGVMFTCGYGTTFTTGRRGYDTLGRSDDNASAVARPVDPYFSGIRCEAGRAYTFSFHMQRTSALAGTNAVAVGSGVLWYTPPPSVTNGNPSERLSPGNLVWEDHFVVLASDNSFQSTVTNKVLTGNVATLTFAVSHNFNIGDIITVAGVDATFDGTYAVTNTTNTSVTYAKTNADVVSAAATGTVHSGGDASLNRQRYSCTSIAPNFAAIYAVPYIVLSRADGTTGTPITRIVSNCMFHVAQQAGVISASVTPTPVPTNYYIIGPMILGDTTEVMGGS